jgi:hypothetical protein
MHSFSLIMQWLPAQGGTCRSTASSGTGSDRHSFFGCGVCMACHGVCGAVLIMLQYPVICVRGPALISMNQAVEQVNHHPTGRPHKHTRSLSPYFGILIN